MKHVFNWVMVIGLTLLITSLIILSNYLEDEKVNTAFDRGYEQGQTKQDSALYKVAYHQGWKDALTTEDTTFIYVDSLFAREYIYIKIKKH